ncbi:hypothetical protein [Paraglaciecola sp. 20A4]|uniref:hypothetical protein n=1 Tax=Paraglaciecola sp. 20A4 TaxID=2687288 RepID=UPI00140D3925|nr:hypothetical protein [Paraglaciecola sp. 20A4]
MTKMNKIAAGLAASLLLVSAAQAQETVTTTASGTVQNSFTLTNDTDLDFGTFRAQNDDAASSPVTATLRRPADPSESSVATNGTANAAVLQSLIEGAPAEYTVSGVSGFSTLTLTVPADGAVTLAAAGSPTGVATFVLNGFEAYKTSGTPGDITLTSSSGTFQVDGSGDATFTLGATLTTVPSTTDTYTDLAYSGDYDITVQY